MENDALLSVELALWQLDAAGDDLTVWLETESPMFTYRIGSDREDLVPYALTHSENERYIR